MGCKDLAKKWRSWESHLEKAWKLQPLPIMFCLITTLIFLCQNYNLDKKPLKCFLEFSEKVVYHDWGMWELSICALPDRSREGNLGLRNSHDNGNSLAGRSPLMYWIWQLNTKIGNCCPQRDGDLFSVNLNWNKKKHIHIWCQKCCDCREIGLLLHW